MKEKNIPFEEFENSVMQKTLEENNALNEILREQYKKSTVIKRRFTGAGFFTDFEVSKAAPSAANLVATSFGDVIASINHSSFDYGFVLFLKDGYISCLEGYTWSDQWPETITSYELKHLEDEE